MKKSFWKDLAVLIVTMTVLLIVCEIVIRTYDAIKGHSFFDNSHRNILSSKPKGIVPFRVFGQSLYEKQNDKLFIRSSHNELYPLKKSSDTYRIVCFGGSTTRNSHSFKKYGMHYPLLLQNDLNDVYTQKNIEVINVGFEAYSSPHSLIVLHLNVVSWEPDLVIFMHNHNDLTASYWPDFRFDYENKYASEYYQPASFYERYTTMNVLFQWSSFYWMVREKLLNIFKGSNDIAKNIKSYGSEPIKDAIDTYKRNVQNFISLSRSVDSKVLLLSQALNKGEKYSDFIPTNKSKMVWPPHEEYLSHHNLYNNLLLNLSVSNKTYFLDCDAMFNSEPELFIDALHYSNKGVIKLSQIISDYIVENNLIK